MWQQQLVVNCCDGYVSCPWFYLFLNQQIHYIYSGGSNGA